MSKGRRVSLATRTTALGTFVRAFREQQGWSQAKLQTELGHHRRQYVSKVETGAIQRPDDQFFDALAKLTNKPREELEELARKPEDKGSPTSAHSSPTQDVFRMACGHCVWSGPLILAAIEGRLPQVEICSFKTDDNSLTWLDASQFPVSVPGPVGWKQGLQSLSAVDVLRLLEDKVIDVGCVPGKVVNDKRKALYRVGCVVDSWTGCSFVCRRDMLNQIRSVSGHTEITSKHLAEVLVDKGNGKPTARKIVALEDQTIAAQLIKDGLEARWTREHAGRLWIDVLHPCANSDFAQQNKFSTLEGEVNDLGLELAGILTWEPHATWLRQTSKDREDLENVPLKFPIGENGRPTHLTFELVVRRADVISPEPRSQALRRVLPPLMLQLRDCAQRLNALDSSLSDFLDLNAVESLGRYFDLLKHTDEANRFSNPAPSPRNRLRYEDIEDTLKAIGGVRFNVHFHPEAIVDMGFRAK